MKTVPSYMPAMKVQKSAHPQLMLWPYNAVVKISSQANKSNKMSILIFSDFFFFFLEC